MHTDTQLREIFHFVFLERLLKIADPALFVLKGGVNLRFYFHSPRYSEDMDLDVLGGAVGTLKKNGYKILEDKAFRRVMATYGIVDVEVNNPEKAKHTETTQRFRVNLVNAAGRKLPTKIEFSRREPAIDEAYLLEELNPEIARSCRKLAYKAQHYSGEAAVIQKVRALAGRPATQARDVFDLDILIRGGYWNSSLVQAAINKSILDKAVEAALSLNYDSYTGHVLEFLELEHRNIYSSKEEWLRMQEKIVGKLIK